MNYVIVEISGRQYKVTPGKSILVDYLGDVKTFECDKVLLKSVGEKLEVGAPYLKEKVTFDILESVKGEKIRVATYKAKANTRKVRGSRSLKSKIVLKG